MVVLPLNSGSLVAGTIVLRLRFSSALRTNCGLFADD